MSGANTLLLGPRTEIPVPASCLFFPLCGCGSRVRSAVLDEPESLCHWMGESFMDHHRTL